MALGVLDEPAPRRAGHRRATFFLHLAHHDRARPRIDVVGITLLAVASSALVLTSVWGGTTYARNSAVILGLIVLIVLAVIGFVQVERRVAEPVMPLRMFRERKFDHTTAAGLIIGTAMFGGLAYMPTYLQMVTGASATNSGLLMIPMMPGLLVTSTVSGQAVSRTGRYKAFPIVGAIISDVGLALLSTMTPSTSVVGICSYLAVMGIGLGLAMQILIHLRRT